MMTNPRTKHRETSGRRPDDFVAGLVAAFFVVCFIACTSPPQDSGPPAGSLPLSNAELERRFQVVNGLVADRAEEQALSLLEQTMKEPLDVASRRDVQRVTSEVRRSKFYRDEPLHLSIELDRPRYRYGEAMSLRLTFMNLGREPLRLVARHRGILDFLTLGDGENAVLDLSIEYRDCDAAGSRVAERENVALRLPADLAIASGGAADLVATVPLSVRRGALFGAVAIEAVLRPVAIEAGESTRFDALHLGTARATLVRREVEKWYDAGLESLDEEIGATPHERPEALLLAAAGLQDAQLRSGIDRLLRAAPNLDPQRRALAMAAIAWLLEEPIGGDAVSALSWWDAHAKALTDTDLSARRIGGARMERGLLAGGAIEIPASTRHGPPAAR